MDSNKTIIIIVAIAIIILICVGLNNRSKNILDACELRTRVAKLMTEHAVYTRLFVVAATSGQTLQVPGLVTRLMKNQEDIGNAIRPIVGDKLANNLILLLKEHIGKAGKVVEVAIGGDKDKISKAVADLRNNSDRTARALSEINLDVLNYSMIKEKFWEHNQYVINQTMLRIKGNYADDIKIYDEYYSHMLMLGDAISTGLINRQ